MQQDEEIDGLLHLLVPGDYSFTHLVSDK
jgi:hypothetical protein